MGSSITYYNNPQKYMPHMFDKGVQAPVVAQVSFTEAPPAAAVIAQARKRTPVRQKLFGTSFAKKAEDVFDLFINQPFFNLYQNQAAFDPTGNTVGAIDLPIRGADYAMKHLSRRIPYSDCSINVGTVARFAELMTDTIREINLKVIGQEQPKATYNCFTTTAFETEPFEDGIFRAANSEYIILATILQPGGRGVYVCYQFDFTFYAVQVGNAFVPVRLLPEFCLPEAPAEKRAMSFEEVLQLVGALAHYQSFSIDRTEETKMADELAAAGPDATNAVFNYLLSCARGGEKDGWWNNAAALVRLLGRLPSVSHADDYKRLMACQSNIWEFQTQVKDVAEQELLKLKKADPSYQNNKTISTEDARAELKRIENTCPLEARLQAAIAVKDSVEDWPDDSKAFYFYIIGDALRQLDSKDERQYAFYAAQVFYAPAGTSIGWYELRKLEEYKTLMPTPENAKMLHEKYPHPASFDELIHA